MKIDFNNEINFDSKEELQCYLNEKELIFIKYFKYEGPVTMQLLPNGGILSVFHNILIIQVKNGMLGVKKLKYEGKTYSTRRFLKKFKDLSLINEVLK